MHQKQNDSFQRHNITAKEVRKPPYKKNFDDKRSFSNCNMSTRTDYKRTASKRNAI